MTSETLTIDPSAVQKPQNTLSGVGFRLQAIGGAADFPRVVELEGKRLLVTGPYWVPTNSRIMRLLPGAPVGYLPSIRGNSPVANETAEEWIIDIAEHPIDLTTGVPNKRRIVQNLYLGKACEAAAPTDSLNTLQGFLMNTGWFEVRAQFFGFTSGTITKYVWSPLTGKWSPAGMLPFTPGVEVADDMTVPVPRGRVAYVASLGAGVTFDLYVTKEF